MACRPAARAAVTPPWKPQWAAASESEGQGERKAISDQASGAGSGRPIPADLFPQVMPPQAAPPLLQRSRTHARNRIGTAARTPWRKRRRPPPGIRTCRETDPPHALMARPNTPPWAPGGSNIFGGPPAHRPPAGPMRWAPRSAAPLSHGTASAVPPGGRHPSFRQVTTSPATGCAPSVRSCSERICTTARPAAPAASAMCFRPWA